MENNLQLNLSETVELVVDFHTATIHNEQMGKVQSHKYIENTSNNRLD